MSNNNNTNNSTNNSTNNNSNNNTNNTNKDKNSDNRPEPKYNPGDIIIISGNKKRHIYGTEPSWSLNTGYQYQIDYGLCCASEGVINEANILRIADEGDKLIAL
jgi:hypothetical protein